MAKSVYRGHLTPVGLTYVSLQRPSLMSDDVARIAQESLMRRLVQATGISEAQARELVELLGTEWSSLVREAKLLKSSGR